MHWIHTYIQPNTHTDIYIYTYIYMHWIHTYKQPHTHTDIHTHTHIHAMATYIQTAKHTYRHTHIYMHTGQPVGKMSLSIRALSPILFEEWKEAMATYESGQGGTAAQKKQIQQAKEIREKAEVCVCACMIMFMYVYVYV
jgi:hypothetical protein